jgi:hypothetical protein
MSVYADTSFLASLYLRDSNSPRALSWLRNHDRPLAFTPLQRHELRNAIRLAIFRGIVSVSAGRTALGLIDQDISSGNLIETPLDWAAALSAAGQLGEAHTESLGIRSLDLLHVGAALSLHARQFVTFDLRQRAAAAAANLDLAP